MNIDVLDEDGASNIAHPEQFGQEKSVYWGKSVGETKVYSKDGKLNLSFFNSVRCGSCMKTFEPSTDFYKPELHEDGCEFQG